MKNDIYADMLVLWHATDHSSNYRVMRIIWIDLIELSHVARWMLIALVGSLGLNIGMILALCV